MTSQNAKSKPSKPVAPSWIQDASSLSVTEQLKDLLKRRGFRYQGDTVKPIFERLSKSKKVDSVVFLGGGWAEWYHEFSAKNSGGFTVKVRIPRLIEAIKNTRRR